MHKSAEDVMKGCGFIYHASVHEVDIGRRGQHVDMYIISLKVSFLPVTSSFNHVNVWSPDQHWNT